MPTIRAAAVLIALTALACGGAEPASPEEADLGNEGDAERAEEIRRVEAEIAAAGFAGRYRPTEALGALSVSGDFDDDGLPDEAFAIADPEGRVGVLLVAGSGAREVFGAGRDNGRGTSFDDAVWQIGPGGELRIEYPEVSYAEVVRRGDGYALEWAGD